MSRPDDPHVREVLRSAHQELRALFGQRDEIVKRIDSVKRTIGGLIDIFGDEILDKDLADALCEKKKSSYPGFTKTCRMVLLEAEIHTTGCTLSVMPPPCSPQVFLCPCGGAISGPTQSIVIGPVNFSQPSGGWL